MIEDLIKDEELTQEELIAKYGPIPENVPNAPVDFTLEEAENNNIETEIEVDENEIADENIQEN